MCVTFTKEYGVVWSNIELAHLYYQKMLIYNPAKRVSAKSVLKHGYFDDLDKTTLPAAENV